MMFFGLLVALALLAAGLHRLRVPGLADWPARMRLAMALALVLAGADHWANPERNLPMLPGWVPLPLETVLFTGACEIAGAVGLLRAPRLPAARDLVGPACGGNHAASLASQIRRFYNRAWAPDPRRNGVANLRDRAA